MSTRTPVFTTSSGIPVDDNQNSITAGARGPVLLQDVHLLEKLQHFNRERIPERVVHAKGSAAYGTFTVTQDITRYTRAQVFSAVGKQTETFLRFSTVGGEKGSADSERDPRGFALRFYTEEGNWDVVGNNTPVFFIKDSIKFPDFIHTQKRDPHTNLKSATMVWDFWSRAPESLHQVTTLFSDRGTPFSYRHMHGFGSHTFSMINAQGERVWVKYHFKTQQGIKNLSGDEAVALAGTDPDHAQRDLFNAIQAGDFPKWTLSIQVMREDQVLPWEQRTGWSAFDVTKVWPHGDFPLIEVGVLELNRNPENYFAEVEQAAFSPANVPPGLGFSPDRMLQGRLFGYHDAQLYRVGTNHQHLPVNRPRCPFANKQRDGAMAGSNSYNNGGSAPNYDAIHAAGMSATGLGHGDPGYTVSGHTGRHDTRGQDDDFSQAGMLFRVMSPAEQQALFSNIAGSLSSVSEEIRERQFALFDRADPAYGAGVRQAIAERNAK